MRMPLINDEHLEDLCKILGDQNEGLSESDISIIFSQLHIHDNFSQKIKWKRIFQSLMDRQSKDDCGNYVFAFLKEALHPARYKTDLDLFSQRRRKVNQILTHYDYMISSKGDISRIEVAEAKPKHQVLPQSDAPATTEAKINNLRYELNKRNAHIDVFVLCTPELLGGKDYFDVVYEASRTLVNKILMKVKIQISDDWDEIARKTFSLRRPLLAVNTLQTAQEQYEQKAFTNMLRGILRGFRDVKHLDPTTRWHIDEAQALNLLGMISYLHHQLDKAVPTNPIHSRN